MKNSDIQNLLDVISRNNVEDSFSLLQSEGIPPERMSIEYDVIDSNSGLKYPPPIVIEKAYKIATNKSLPNGFFQNIGIKSPHFLFLNKMGFQIVSKKNEAVSDKNVMIKKIKDQDISGELYIPKKYVGIDNYFPDPRIIDPNPIGENPNLIKLKMRWDGIDSDYRSYHLKNFRKEFHSNNDTRIAGSPKLKIGDIIVFIKNEDSSFNVKTIDNRLDCYSDFLTLLDRESYKLMSTDNFNAVINSKINGMNTQPLNQILYGPPGTGKTDATVEKALEILNLKTDDRTGNREIFRSLLNKKIFFVTMHPSYSYEDFVQGIKPKTSDKGELLFEPKPGIFKNLAELSLPYVNSYYFPGFLMSVYEEEVRKIVDPNMNQQQLLDYIGKKCGVAGGTIKNTRDYFDNVVGNISSRVGYSDDNFIANNIDKEFYQDLSKKYLRVPKNMLLSSFKNNWVEKSSVIASQEKTETNFVLILDEINRANISKVFGELITLLEEDKRIGNENELSVTLPSGEIFSVPQNLFIIGTMNTADKSIALVDIALRRRFQFIPVYPDSSVITNYCKSDDKAEKSSFMDSLNTRLRVDKGVDFQIGHAYFLKDNSLADVINENIIPLLVEYLRNDLEKVKKLLLDLGKPLDDDYYNKTGLLKYIG